MATKINADTIVGGAVVTADASGILELQSAGTTALTLSGANVTFATAPSVTGGAAVVTTTGTQTLTNKTLQNPNITSGLLLNNAAGTSGQVLVSNGAGNAPTWGSAGETTPVGAVQYFAGTSTATYPGSKWLQANGAIISQSTYPTLYDRVGLITDFYTKTFVTKTVDSSGYKTIESVTYANNLFVSTATNQIRTSTNGTTWTDRGVTGSGGYSSAYLNGLYYVGGYGVLRTSTDAVTWTNVTIPDNGQIINGLAYGNGVYVYCGTAGALGTSSNGTTWVSQTAIPRFLGSDCNDITFGDGKFYMAGKYYDGVTATSGFVATSTDGVTWSVNSTSIGQYLEAVNYYGGTIVTGGQTSTGNAGQIYVSTDGNNSYVATSTINTNLGIIRSIKNYNGLFMIVGGGGSLGYSYDAINWKTILHNNDAYGLAIGPTPNKVLVSGTNGRINYVDAFSYSPTTSFKLPTTINNIASPGAYYVRVTA